MTNHSRIAAVGLGWLALAFVCWAPAVATPLVDRLSPSIGQVGHVVILEGSDLAGHVLDVEFGRAQAVDAQNPGRSGRVISLLVPNKLDPRDPDTVTITVKVDGVEAISPTRPLQFTYSIPQPAPVISDFKTDDPSHPQGAIAGQPFILTLSGSNFLIGRRAPTRCLALGPQTFESQDLIDAPSDTSASFFFTGLTAAGSYEFLIAFSDGSGASILALNFIEQRIFGFPPNIESVSFETSPQQAIECDFTSIVEEYLCSLGAPGAKAEPGVFIGGIFTHVRFQVNVTDPDSTPTQSNVLLVGASFINPDSQSETTAVLFDDGSFATFRSPQKANVPEDCSIDSAGECTCSLASFQVVSSDALAGDSVFSRNLAFVDRSTPSLGLLQDCIMLQYRAFAADLAAGSTLEFRIEAVDRQGNLATWPGRPTATIGPGSFFCSGDECGCCLLTSGVDCKGKPGMPSPDFPGGICMSAL
jgi:hypothetical protein